MGELDGKIAASLPIWPCRSIRALPERGLGRREATFLAVDQLYMTPGEVSQMIGVTPIDKFRAFNSEAALAMGEAFDDAWKSLKASRSLFTSSFREDKAQEILASRIIELAQRGERDPSRLRDEVLDNLK